MSKILNWFFDKPKTAQPETSEQILARLHGGEATLNAVQQRIDAARERLKARDPKANADLQAAKSELEELAGPLEILREELAEALAREAAEERQRKVDRVEEIRGRVCNAAVRQVAGGLIAREVELLVALVETRKARRELRLELDRLVTEGAALAASLGLARIEDHTGVADSSIVVGDALFEHLRTLDGSDPRRRALHDIAHELSPFNSRTR